MKYAANFDKLLNYGVFNYNEDWSNYLKLGFTEQDAPALLQLALDEELLQDEDRVVNSAPYHAWRILGLLKAEVAISPLLDEIGDDDWSCEDGCEILGLIGGKAIEPIKNALSDPVVDGQKKGILVEALGKIIANTPEYREQGVAFFTEYLANITDKDSYLAGFVVCELMDLDAKESIETIRAAFQRGCVEISIAGDIEEVEINMGFRQYRETTKPSYHGFSDIDFEEIRREVQATNTNVKVIPRSEPFVRLEPSIKIGRNEPCPCDSGKKYKNAVCSNSEHLISL